MNANGIKLPALEADIRFTYRGVDAAGPQMPASAHAGKKIEDVYEDGFLVPNTSTLPPPALYEGLGVISSEECPLFH